MNNECPSPPKPLEKVKLPEGLLAYTVRHLPVIDESSERAAKTHTELKVSELSENTYRLKKPTYSVKDATQALNKASRLFDISLKRDTAQRKRKTHPPVVHVTSDDSVGENAI